MIVIRKGAGVNTVTVNGITHDFNRMTKVSAAVVRKHVLAAWKRGSAR